MSIHITTPLDNEIIKKLKIGDEVFISGTIYTARDAAHQKLVDLLNDNKALPFDTKGAVIYYVGPSPAQPGQAIGAAGPTTSYRMDPFVEDLLQVGMKGMIGKGARSAEVVNGLKTHCAVYFGATGGAAALLSKTIKKAEVIAFDELGPEAVRKLEVENMPLIVINDCTGKDLYVEGRKKWADQ
ncbi:MAG: Fe-S-containing hydro-lyase [Bacteroidota bacterium]|nr:Fe-S-containing hydro-lyase [Bacteroidota bacterium]